MLNSPKLLLIDGNNLCKRVYYSTDDPEYKGRGAGLLFGVFRSFVSLAKKYPDHFMIMAWDSTSKRRLEETTRAMNAGLIPSVYKANREKEMTADWEDFLEQRGQLQEVLILTRVQQVRVDGYEADDVVYSYAMWAVEHGGEAVIMSSDKDFYQCLQPDVTVYDAMKDTTWTLEKFVEEYGILIDQWLEVRAISGEVGDNIFGVDGWGEKTATKYIKLYGSIEKVNNALRAMKRGKREQVFIDQVERAKLARGIAKLDRIPNLPMPKLTQTPDSVALKQWFIEMGFITLMKEAERLA